MRPHWNTSSYYRWLTIRQLLFIERSSFVCIPLSDPIISLSMWVLRFMRDDFAPGAARERCLGLYLIIFTSLIDFSPGFKSCFQIQARKSSQDEFHTAMLNYSHHLGQPWFTVVNPLAVSLCTIIFAFKQLFLVLIFLQIFGNIEHLSSIWVMNQSESWR